MIVSEEHITTAERYSAAIQSSDLSVRANRRGDVDLLIAAGWLGDGLGAKLYRLAVEFDAVRAELRGPGPLNPTERLLILWHLKSLRETRDALGKFAVTQATLTNYRRNNEEVCETVGRVLDVFLDPTCHACEGRSFTGGGTGEHSGPKRLCRACRATGQRRKNLGRDQAEIGFARELLAHMEHEMQKAQAKMGRFLRAG